MRIAFVHPRFPSAEGTGATHSATQIVSGLADAGHDIRVYCPQVPDEEPDTTDLELRHLAGNSRHPHTNTRLNKEIVSRLGELRTFDVVHSYMTPLIPSIARVGEDSDVKTVVTLNAYGGTCAKNDLLYLNREHCRSKSMSKCLNCITRASFDGSDRGYLYQTASRLLSLRLIKDGEKMIEHIDGFHALSPHVRDAYVDFGYERDKIDVIPNILDSQFDIKHISNFKEPINLLYVGALKKSKGIDRLIDVFSAVQERTELAVLLTIVGDGPFENDLRREIETKDLTELIEMRGHTSYNCLPSVYANHDLFLYPGRWDEPFGRVFLEAMATGTPIVTTDVGSANDIIGRAGKVTQMDNDSLIDGVLSALNYQLLQEYSEVGKRRIDQYRISEIVPRFEELYTGIF